MASKVRCHVSPIRIGSPYEMYRPMVAVYVAAVKATVEPSDGSARMKCNVAAVCCCDGGRLAVQRRGVHGRRRLCGQLWE